MFTFRPAIFDALRGYDRPTFFSDLSAGLTVGIVSLPLAIGFGIASGVTPAQGIWTAIIAGFLISFLGGSRVQIGGPTGAFVPILAAIVATHGYGGLAVATVMAGMILVGLGAFRLGSLIKFIPYPVIAGFTSGIAVIIFIGQLKEFMGLKAAPLHEAPLQLWAVLSQLGQTHLPTFGLGALAVLILIFWPKGWKAVPPSLVAVALPSVLVAVFNMDVATVGTKFGGIPSGFPSFTMPAFSFEMVRALAGPAGAIALLGAIESLLSAMVADGITEDRHDSNQELMGQGIANIVCPFAGGISATGAIARTATSIRSGAKTPVAGIIHAMVLLVFVLAAAPLASRIPLASLSAVLIVVAFRMGEWDNFVELARSTRSDFVVLLLTFSLTVIFDLTIAVGAGMTAAAVLFVRRMEEITRIRLVTADSDAGLGSDSIRGKHVPEGTVVFRIDGPFFFGAAEKLDSALLRYAVKPRLIVFRMPNVPAIDASGLHALRTAFDKFQRHKIHVLLSGVQPQPMKVLYNSGFADLIGLDNICPNIDAALERARKLVGEQRE